MPGSFSDSLRRSTRWAALSYICVKVVIGFALVSFAAGCAGAGVVSSGFLFVAIVGHPSDLLTPVLVGLSQA
jgi:hypothetical protein